MYPLAARLDHQMAEIYEACSMFNKHVSLNFLFLDQMMQ